MKNKLRPVSVILCIILTLTMLCCAVPFMSSAGAYSAGDIFEFGSYPQSRVTDSTLISSLDAQTKNWVSYSYLSGTGAEGTMTASDYMKYCDISYGGEKYRAVTFSSYRPRQTYKPAQEKSSFVDDNGYAPDTVYYFRYEPLEWKILDASAGLMISQYITDSQPYSKLIYVSGTDSCGAACYGDDGLTAKACKYTASSVYSFLNEDFYNTAFTADEQSQIASVPLVNDSFNKSWQQYAAESTDDKIFLLSYEDIQNTALGFAAGLTADESRTATGTDYAGIQGLQRDETGNSPWWLRNAGNTSRNAAFVDYSGFAGTGSVEYSDKGIRPAIKCTAILPQTSHKITFDYDGGNETEPERTVTYGSPLGALPETRKLNYAFEGWFTAKSGGTQVNAAQIIKADIKLFARWTVCGHDFEFTDSKEPTCVEAGYKKYVCSVCGLEKTEIIPMTDHIPAPFVIENSTVSTCLEAGEYEEVVYCSYCSTELSRELKYKELGAHIPLDPAKEKETPPTCTEGGNYEGVVYCGICGEELSREYTETPPLGHDLIHYDGKPSTCKKPGRKPFDICSRCDYTTFEELPLADHTPSQAVRINEKQPSCTEKGSYDSAVYCTVCGAELSRENNIAVPAKGHTDENDDGICEVCRLLYDKEKNDKYNAAQDRAEKEAAAKKLKIGIRTPSKTEIPYGHTIVLHYQCSGTVPDGYKLVWSADGSGFEGSENSLDFRMKSVSGGESAVTLRLVDPDGKTVKDESGKEITASVSLKSKAGFFDKVIWFFKWLFRLDLFIDKT